ncbi:hypothetical protein HD554DRAFT_2140566, partial [Boletus coccyginus]
MNYQVLAFIVALLTVVFVTSRHITSSDLQHLQMYKHTSHFVFNHCNLAVVLSLLFKAVSPLFSQVDFFFRLV